MNRMSRLTIAGLLVGALALTAVGVWAAPTFRGSVPPPPDTGTSTGGEPIYMGTVIIDPTCTDCTVTVEVVHNPEELAPAPGGKTFLGDAFQVDIEGPAGSTVKISFAFPPEFAAKGATIYKLDTLATPPVWVEVPGVVIENGVISVEGGAGTYVLVGNS